MDGNTAISVAANFRPEVLILDLGLPGLSGFDVCSRLKANPELRTTKVIVVSGYYSDDDRIRAMAAGCDIHLQKPADPTLLLALVRTSSRYPRA